MLKKNADFSLQLADGQYTFNFTTINLSQLNPPRSALPLS